MVPSDQEKNNLLERVTTNHFIYRRPGPNQDHIGDKLFLLLIPEENVKRLQFATCKVSVILHLNV